MATISERLAYVLTFDTSSGVKSLDQFGKAADKNLDKAEKKLDKLGSNMVKFGAGAVTFAGVAGLGLARMAQGAAEAEANAAALEQVVGELVASDIKKWAEDSAKGVGMASKDAVSAATTFAQLGKIIGLGGAELGTFSTDLVELSADFAAFKDVAPEQALQDIQAAFAGSTEVMRKYGIFLDDATLKSAYFRETGEEVSGTLTAQQKIVAINAELYRQGADMIGQWDRESGELLGKQATLRAELTNLSDAIGAGVLPMMTSVVGVAADMAGAFASLSPEAASLIGKFAALGTAGIALIGTLSMVAGQVIKMRDRFTDADGAINNLGRAAKGVGIGVGIAAAALVIFSLNAERARRAAADLDEELRRVEEASDDMAVDTFMDAVREAFTDTRERIQADAGIMITELGGFEDALLSTAETAPAVAFRILELEDATGGLTAALMAEGASAKEAAEHIELLRGATAAAIAGQRQANQTQTEFNEAVDGGTEALAAGSDAALIYGQHAAGMRGEVDKAAETQDELRAAAEAVAEAHEDLSGTFDDVIGKIEELTEAQGDLIGSEVDIERATIEFAQAMAEAVAVMGEAEVGSDEYRLAVLDAKDAVRDQAQALADNEIATREATDEVLTASDKNAILAGHYRDLANYAIPEAAEAARGWADDLDDIPDNVVVLVKGDTAAARQQARDYIGQLGGIPKSTETKILALIDQGRIADAERALNNAARDRNANIRVNVTGGGGTLIRAGQVGIAHEGGLVTGGGGTGIKSFAGLKDDEVPAILQKGEAVLTKGQQAAIGSGGPSLTINHYGPSLSPADIARGFKLARLAQG